MNDRKSLTLKALAFLYLLIASFQAPANSNFVTNPYLPYPPSCARMPSSGGAAAVQTGAVQFFESEISLPDQQTFEQVDVVVRAYRTLCSEAGRSLIWIEFHLPKETASKDIRLMLPVIAADYQGENFVQTSILIPVGDPNSWGEGSGVDRGRILLVTRPHGDVDTFDIDYSINSERSWWFLLDNESPLADGGYNIPFLMPAEAYNSRFSLRFRYPPNISLLQFEVPATAEMNFPVQPTLPISGRLSGNWVIEGARDQGLMLAISTLPTKPAELTVGFPPLSMVLFYSHYTFDPTGKMLWLTGTAQLQPGSRTVTIPVDEVTQGEFRSDKPAQRRTVGQVTLTANNCNDITMEYDYNGLGLGSGTRQLQRLFSLETAGYDCRDYAARVKANQ